MSATYPPPGKLTYVPAPYRTVTLSPSQQLKIPPNVDAIMNNQAATLKLPAGQPDLTLAAALAAPLALRSLWPKGQFTYVAGAGGTTTLKLYSYT